MIRCPELPNNQQGCEYSEEVLCVAIFGADGRMRSRWLPRGVEVFGLRDCALVQWVTRSGFVYAVAYIRFGLGDDLQRRQRIWDAIHGGPMKRKDRKAVEALKYHANDDKILKAYPHVSEFMRAAVYEGEEAVRTSPTVTFWCQSGEWRASVKDRAESLVMWLSAPTLLELLGLIESYCLNSEGPWRHDDYEHERNGKRKKKDA